MFKAHQARAGLRMAMHLALFAMLANSALAGLIVTGSKGPAVTDPAALAVVPNLASYDNIIFRLTGYNDVGVDDTVTTVFFSGLNSVSGIEGTFTATGGTMFFSDDDGSGSGLGGEAQAENTKRPSINSASSLNSFRSFANFEGTAGVSTPASAFAENLTSFGFTWFTTGDNKTKTPAAAANAKRTRLTPFDTLAGTFDQTLLARIFVTPGTHIAFNGVYSSAVGFAPLAFSFNDGPTGITEAINVTTVPMSGSVGSGKDFVISNAAAAAGNTRDSATPSGLTITTTTANLPAANVIGQTGLSNGAIAGGESQIGKISLNGAGLLNGVGARGTLSFNIEAGPSGAGVGAGFYSIPLSASVDKNIGDGIAPVAAGGDYHPLSGRSGLASAAGSTHLNSTFEFLAGRNHVGGDTIVSGAWQLRELNEQRPPLSQGANVLTSDRLDLTGTDGDLFVLQMTYDPIQIGGNDNELAIAAAGHLFLASFDTATGRWVNAVQLNHGSNYGAANVQGKWNGQMALGTWGVDRFQNVVWAVLDHNSLFASTFAPLPVPEPSALILGCVGIAGLLRFARQRI